MLIAIWPRYPKITKAKPPNKIVLDIPPVKNGTANTATPIMSTSTPRFLINSFMVIDIL